MAVWRPWAVDVRGSRIESGHHIAEEAPTEVAALVIPFLSAGPLSGPAAAPG